MTITPFYRNDIVRFLDLALAEQWITGEWELEFLLSAFPGGGFCMRDANGNAAGFVTSLKHDRGGWIGNLIVRPDLRGEGRGEALFGAALEALRAAGSETVWLTASEMGRPLYEKRGFRSIDRIVRWVGQAPGAPTDTACISPAPFDLALDRLCWGDRRDRLLAWASRRGKGIAGHAASGVLQPVGKAAQIGPWAARNEAAARRTVSTLIGSLASGTRVICDAPAANTTCSAILHSLGFSRRSDAHLMYCGAEPDYRPEYLYGLATLGSSG
jgi:GNAT superfamily N-acetyltransferase